MRVSKIRPGYAVYPEVHKLVEDYAKKMSKRLGINVSNNQALEMMIREARKGL